MNFRDLTIFVRDTIKKYPKLKNEVIDIYQLAKDEIEDDGNEFHECELALQEINELIKGR